MSEKLPQLTARRIIQVLRQDGWEFQGQKGSHQQFTHPTKPGKVTVPVHKGRDIPPRTIRDIMTQAGLTVDQVKELL